MAKTSFSTWDTTASNNTDINSISLAEGMSPAGVNNAMREMMSQLITAVPDKGNADTISATWTFSSEPTIARLINATTLTTTTGTAAALTLTAASTITAYSAGQVFSLLVHTAPSANATLNIDGLGAKNIKVYNSSGTLIGIPGGGWQNYQSALVMYDGTQFIIIGGLIGGSSALVPGVVKVLDEDDCASNSAAWPPSQQSAKAYIDGFTSSAQTITSAGLLTLAHGLGATPTRFSGRLECQTTEAGWAVNDIAYCDIFNNSDATTTAVNAIYADATNVYFVYSSTATVFQLPNKSTGTRNRLTNSKWKLIIGARL